MQMTVLTNEFLIVFGVLLAVVAFLYSSVGHGGASGRFEAIREIAKEYSFLLDLEGIKS